MKIIVTTSDRYHHILPIFFHLYEKYWGDPLDLVGYAKPDNLPDYVTFYSLGEQKHRTDFAVDMRKYFVLQDDHFIWMMEDTFIREPVERGYLEIAKDLRKIENMGRVGISTHWTTLHYRPTVKSLGDHCFTYEQIKGTPYRLSTQPSIWNKEFLLKYLKPGLSAQDFETQETNDNYRIFAINKKQAPVNHNEGVRRFDLHKYNLEGIDKMVVFQMKRKGII
jgi:hypothetical protein